MKKFLSLLLLIMMLLPCLCAQAEGPAFNQRQQMLFDAVRYCNDLPKDSQVISAMEYFCKVEGQQLRLMLMNCTQTEHIANHFGIASTLVLLDTETGDVISYTNHVPYEGHPVASKLDAMNLVFSAYSSYVSFGAEQICTDSELCFPLSAEELNVVNQALRAYFTNPADN